MQVPYFPPLQSAAQFTPELCSQLIQAAAGFTQQQQHNQQTGTSYPSGLTAAGAAAAATGPGASGPQVHSIKQWVMSAEVAEEYGAWGNRLLLAGDAAHRWVNMRGGRLMGRLFLLAVWLVLKAVQAAGHVGSKFQAGSLSSKLAHGVNEEPAAIRAQEAS